MTASPEPPAHLLSGLQLRASQASATVTDELPCDGCYGAPLPAPAQEKASTLREKQKGADVPAAAASASVPLPPAAAAAAEAAPSEADAIVSLDRYGNAGDGLAVPRSVPSSLLSLLLS